MQDTQSAPEAGARIGGRLRVALYLCACGGLALAAVLTLSSKGIARDSDAAAPHADDATGAVSPAELTHRMQPAGVPAALAPTPEPPIQPENPAGTSLAVTHHTLERSGREALKYQATVGKLPLREGLDHIAANFVFTSYEKEHETEDGSPRPITFAFNGGPGASSLWLHFSLGPKRVRLTPEGRSPPPPYGMTDNPSTWLDFTDLVFVDPIGTGYSRPASPRGKTAYYGMDGDIDAMSHFVALYVATYRRWSSPKYLVGESYGALRALGVASQLQEKHGIDFNGLVLISPPLDFRQFSYYAGDDTPYPLVLPSYCATALYHNRLAPELAADPLKTLAEVEQWAMHDYATALALGDALQADALEATRQNLARCTGLAPSFVRAENARVTNREFIRELLRDQGLTIGWQDGRFTTTLDYEIPFGDPSSLETTGPFVSTWYDYARKELNYEVDQAYEFMSYEVNQSWQWGSAVDGPINLLAAFREAIARNRHLRVLVACGYFDLNTPYFGTMYSVEHLSVLPEIRKNIAVTLYAAGHQMYISEPCLEAFSENAAAFYAGDMSRIRERMPLAPASVPDPSMRKASRK